MKGSRTGTSIGWIAVAALGIGVAGCSGSSTGKGGPLPPAPSGTTTAPVSSDEATEVFKTSTSIGTTAALPIQVALSEVSPGNFPPSPVTGDSSVSTTVTGDSSAGNIVFDFSGSGLTGQITANYNANGSAGGVSVTFANFGVQTSTDTFTMNGTLNVAYSYSGSSATGTVTGNVRITINAVTVDVAVSLTVDYDGAQNRFVISGTTNVVHSTHGVWSTTFAGLIYDGAAGEVTAGTITLVQSAPAATATYVITGPGAGTFTIAPAGIQGSFTI